MASSSRSQFTSRFGFIMAAAGSAVGLGNVWGFPTQAASNGGAVFLIVYLLMVFLLAFPMLVAELTIGRYGQSNPIRSFHAAWPKGKAGAILLGVVGMIVVSLILSFYAIVAGWLVGSFFSSGLDLLGLNSAGHWLTTFGTERNLVLMIAFMALTMFVVRNGVANGIEKWSTRLMPLLFVLFGLLTVYIFTQEGAWEGLKMYLIPDISHLTPKLIVSAMGQAFFSLSLGVCVMTTYGSYLKKDTNLPKTAAQVALIDTGVAFIAGLMILPAMFVAKHNGVQIFSDSGALLNSDTLVFTVLPAMFDTMGAMGAVIGLVFFLLMIIAALTSSISMLEVPVACATEELKQSRTTAVLWIGGLVTIVSAVIVMNFSSLFGLVIQFTTVYSQPIIALLITLIVGWIWNRNQILNELKQGCPEIENSWFWKIWPVYVRLVCPVLMLLVFFA
ncbi:sodium-dependent transporter [Vibrio fluvialis]|uniref:sodium-dependent transporter n=1 Tax=Vibrio fluvialis TaxID=676 RepID=UPI00192C6870|nr:sodium-dependent transporter [Vibrio fluvialis]EKO3485077.1 sodium-dependent transporter [Vibrio fluvialis]EKO3534458.1 sodium-dependent transporter [Vibrio fluvialis]EKO3537987.1 sodium-dependent transporter [Vibrio fluvialis]MBL4237327.1 sodium-dependent transporter [Vibrio fluvialis]MBL4264521.1 sodium-dependent transporter [Vibrio fluvialis]